jgi:hypothetical protein
VIGARTMKSVLTKRNKQKINTGNFENIDVLVEITEELEWDSKEEYNEKSKALNSKLIADYNCTRNQVISDLNKNN